MHMFPRETVPLQAILSLIALALAVLCGAMTSCAQAEEDKTPTVGVSDPASQEDFVRVSLVDLLSTEDLTIIQDSDGPIVTVFEVCEVVKGYDDFEPNPSHEFSRSLFGRAWLYAEIEEIGSTEESDGIYSLSLSADVIVSDSDKRVVWRREHAYSFDQKLSSPAFGVWACAYVPTIFLGKGDYNVEITINDNSNGRRSRVNTLVRIK